MNQVGVSLTIIGVIATLISLLFAGAALYVSHKRARHVTPAAAPAPKAPVVRPIIAPVEAPPADGALFQKPLFRKLGSTGVEDAVPTDRQEPSQYVWE